MPSERIQRQVGRLLDEIEQALERRDWVLAQELAKMVFAIDPENADASAFSKLAEAGFASPAEAIEPALNGDGAAAAGTSASADERIQILKQLIHIAASSLDIAEAFDGVADQVRRLIDFDHLAVALHQPGDDFLTIRAIVGELPGGLRSPLVGSGSGEAIRSGRPSIVPDTLLNPQSPRQRLVSHLYRSILHIPLKSRGRTFGVLNFGSARPNAFGDNELKVAQDVADHLAVVLDYSLRHKEVEAAGREQERARLARELHDSLAQALTGIVIQLDEAKERYAGGDEAALRAVRSAQELACESLEEARRSVWDLQPAALESGDLAEALEREVRRTGTDELDASFRVTGAGRRVDQRCEQALLRIAQESLSNVRRHSGAGRVEVALDYGESEVRLQISDDGAGFDSASSGSPGDGGGGFGLTSMRQRANLVGGRTDIDSAPGLGTQVRVVVPALPPTDASPMVPSLSDGVTPASTDPAAASSEVAARNGTVRVLIVDDHEIVRSGLRQMIEREPGIDVVGEAADGEQALRLLEDVESDVMLLDMQMPGLDGIGTLQRMRESGMEQRVLLLSVLAADEQILEGFRAGARGYVLKDVARAELGRAIRTVHEGGSLLPPIVAERLLDTDGAAHREQLSPRELDVLKLLATGARNKEIAISLTISENTVRWHVSNLHQKLDVTTRTEAVHVARERGLLRA